MATGEIIGPANGLVSMDVLRELAAQPGVDDLLGRTILPMLEDSRLHSIAKDSGRTPKGFRPGRAPRPALLAELGKAVHRSSVAAQLALGEFFEATAEIGRRIRRTKLRDLPGGVADLSRQFDSATIGLWLLADPRRGAQRLVARAASGAPIPKISVPPAASKPRGVAGGVGGTGGSGRSGESKQAEAFASGAVAGREHRRRLKVEATARRKAETEAKRLRQLLEKMRRERDEANQRAALKGQENGQLRAEVRRLEGEVARAAAAGPEPRAAIIVETAACLERDELLLAANREAERVTRELAESRLRADWSDEARIRLETQNTRLRAAIGRRPVGVGPAAGYTLTAPFRYRGPGGAVNLAPGYALTISQGPVDGHELVDGDIVSITITPPARVTLAVESPRPRETAIGTARRVAVDVWPEPLWQVVRVLTDEKTGERMGQPLGWLSDDEARLRGLAEGDPVRVVIPVAAPGEGRPLRTPAPGLPALPPVRVVQKYEVEETGGGELTPKGPAAGARRQAGQRKPVAGPRRAARGLALGRLKAKHLPYAGQKILVVGGDSWRAQYRRRIEAIGAEFLFQSAGDDAAQARAKARAADMVLVETRYVSHKVGNAVRDELARLGRTFVPVNSTGQRALVEAIRRGQTPDGGEAAG